MYLPALVLSLLLSTPDLLTTAAVRGTVWIRAGDRSVGTGWVVDVERRWIVTARHVIADREKVEVFFVDHRDGRVHADRVHYLSERADLLKRGRLATGTLVAKNDNADLAILHLDLLPNDVPALRLSTSPARTGNLCSSVGHRHDSELLWNRTTGVVRQTGRLAEGYFWAGKKIGVNSPVLFVQSPIESGESGAALLDSDGRVIGVVSAVSNRTPGLSIATDVSEVAKLLSQARMDDRAVSVTSKVDRKLDVAALMHGSVWVRPRATDGRFAGVLIDRERRLVLTTAAAVGSEEIIDVVAPKWEGHRLIAEAWEYQDLLGLRLAGRCVQGVVLVRDAGRDLAVIELDSIPDGLEAIGFGTAPKMGERVSSLSHPTGEELMWLFASGAVRSVGYVGLRRDGGEATVKVASTLLQLPHQGSASGGPVVNSDGKLVGVVATREGARQELAYAASPDEIRDVLKTAHVLASPGTAAEWNARAKFLLSRSRAASALKAQEQATRLAPENNEMQATLARVLAVNGKVDAARTSIEAVASIAKTAEVYGMLAEASRELGDLKRAMTLVEASLALNPKLASALVTRAALSSGESALIDINLALSLDSAVPRAHLVRAELHDLKDPDRNEKVFSDLSRAIEMDPHNVAPRLRRSKFFTEVKEHKKAAADLARLTELEPLRSDWHLALAESRFLAGERSGSAEAFALALRVDPALQPRVFQRFRTLGRGLHDENPADAERVAAWYLMAIRSVLPWVKPESPKRLLVAVAQALAEKDDKRRMEMLLTEIDEFAGPANRPPK
jgi:S1-C subfamily serine protease/tetratricopeptide (TPR) repeat protein